MNDSEALIQRRGLHENELLRIEEKFLEYLPKLEAERVTSEICGLVLEVDEELDRILSDPLVGALYEYDGLFFRPRGTHLFHRAFNGIHILRSLDNHKIEIFFRWKDKSHAVQWMMEELGSHTWEAKVRRMNWEEEGTLNTVTKEVIEAIVEDIQERRKAYQARPLSPEEETFFKSYEVQMSDWQGACQSTRRQAGPKS
jgi:hypothetical protein